MSDDSEHGWHKTWPRQQAVRAVQPIPSVIPPPLQPSLQLDYASLEDGLRLVKASAVRHHPITTELELRRCVPPSTMRRGTPGLRPTSEPRFAASDPRSWGLAAARSGSFAASKYAQRSLVPAEFSGRSGDVDSPRSSVDVFEPNVESTTWYDGSESFSRAVGRPGVLRPDESPRWYPPLRVNGTVQRNASYPDLVQLCTLPRFSFCSRNSTEERQKARWGNPRGDEAERAEGPVSRMLILSRLRSRETARRTLTAEGTP
mmetsp:Transcript_41906/g.100702  ORF Transcript_41906/g.100702 Transcript_41906/m.100702 type:complete len:260 (-) Transcript_41906:27-806(-)